MADAQGSYTSMCCASSRRQYLWSWRTRGYDRPAPATLVVYRAQRPSIICGRPPCTDINETRNETASGPRKARSALADRLLR